MQAAARNPQLEGMGTTLVAAWELVPADGAEPELLVASVGDSRAYVCDDRGLREVTDDQTWVNEIGRRLGIDDATLKVHPMRHVLTMAIGVSQPLRVNTYRISLRPGVQVLLCSDGLHGVIPASIISEGMMNNARSLEEKCKFLVDAARSAGGPDNITTVIVRAS
jgi:protein phosphatase